MEHRTCEICNKPTPKTIWCWCPRPGGVPDFNRMLFLCERCWKKKKRQ